MSGPRLFRDPRVGAVETWYAAVNAMQLGRINRTTRTLPAVGPLSTADGDLVERVLTGRHLPRAAVQDAVVRDSAGAAARTGGQYDEYVYHWVDTLQTYWLRRPVSSRP